MQEYVMAVEPNCNCKVNDNINNNVNIKFNIMVTDWNLGPW